MYVYIGLMGCRGWGGLCERLDVGDGFCLAVECEDEVAEPSEGYVGEAFNASGCAAGYGPYELWAGLFALCGEVLADGGVEAAAHDGELAVVGCRGAHVLELAHELLELLCGEVEGCLHAVGG